MGVSLFAGKKSKSKKSTAVKGHMVFVNIVEDFKILPISDSDFHVKVKKSLLMSGDEPI